MLCWRFKVRGQGWISAVFLDVVLAWQRCNRLTGHSHAFDRRDSAVMTCVAPHYIPKSMISYGVKWKSKKRTLLKMNSTTFLSFYSPSFSFLCTRFTWFQVELTWRLPSALADCHPTLKYKQITDSLMQNGRQNPLQFPEKLAIRSIKIDVYSWTNVAFPLSVTQSSTRLPNWSQWPIKRSNFDKIKQTAT